MASWMKKTGMLFADQSQLPSWCRTDRKPRMIPAGVGPSRRACDSRYAVNTGVFSPTSVNIRAVVFA